MSEERPIVVDYRVRNSVIGIVVLVATICMTVVVCSALSNLSAENTLKIRVQAAQTELEQSRVQLEADKARYEEHAKVREEEQQRKEQLLKKLKAADGN